MLGFTESPIFRGKGEGGHEKKQQIGGCLKGGLWDFADLRGSWRERGDSVYEEGLMLQCTRCVVPMVDTSKLGDW